MNESLNKSNPVKDEIQPMDYLIVVAKHSGKIIYSSAIVTVLTYFILLILPNQYTSTVRLLPPQQNLSLSGQIINSLGMTTTSGFAGSSLGGMAASVLGLSNPADLYVGILMDDTISDRIIERFNLREYYSSSLSSNPPIEDIRKQLSKQVNIEATKDGLIVIEVTDEDPRRAAEMTNAFADELDKLLQEMARKEAKNNLAFLEKERQQTSKDLAKAEEALRTFSEQTSVLQIDAQTKVMLEYIANLRANIDAKEVQIKVMRQQASPSNYDLMLLETELKGLNEKLREIEKKTNNNYCGEANLTTSKVPTLGLEYLRIVREAKYQEAIYQMYSKLVELARMDAARNISVVATVGQAIAPEKRSNKRLLPSILAGFCTGFIMIFWAFVQEWNEQSKKTEAGQQRFALLHEYLQPHKRRFTRIKNLLKFWKTSK